MTKPPFIIGTMRLGDWGADLSSKELEYFIDQCVDLGLTDFDHADIYGHYTDEEKFGQVLRRRPDLKNKIKNTTKCGIQLVCEQRPAYTLKSYDTRRAHILGSVDRSLQYLGVDTLDCLLIHRPDYLMDVAEIADCYQKLHDEGKVRSFGVSNFNVHQAAALQQFFPLTTHQVEYSLMHIDPLENGIIDQCKTLGITLEAWSPFQGGTIFSKPTSEQHKRIHDVASHLQHTYDCALDQLLLAWILKHPYGIRPVLGTSKIARVQGALQAVDISLSYEDWYRLLEAARGYEVA